MNTSTTKIRVFFKKKWMTNKRKPRKTHLDLNNNPDSLENLIKLPKAKKILPKYFLQISS